MGTKTIGLREDAYERLKARKRESESFTDLVERLLEETTTDWREGFGTLSTGEMEALEDAVAESRDRTSQGLGDRQQCALDALANVDEETDETA
ncbi:antitoxin VapB family protein [Halolamina sediminis]|uniref:antitoxin VapB family protein n=1 Tax=Halolamina sediminis TaxID=1480675 RepID=UPI0006B45CF3|nr:antitoxin VapB family protein [Halolamina sediminis]